MNGALFWFIGLRITFTCAGSLLWRSKCKLGSKIFASLTATWLYFLPAYKANACWCDFKTSLSYCSFASLRMVLASQQSRLFFFTWRLWTLSVESADFNSDKRRHGALQVVMSAECTTAHFQESSLRGTGEYARRWAWGLRECVSNKNHCLCGCWSWSPRRRTHKCFTQVCQIPTNAGIFQGKIIDRQI